MFRNATKKQPFARINQLSRRSRSNYGMPTLPQANKPSFQHLRSFSFNCPFRGWERAFDFFRNLLSLRDRLPRHFLVQ